MKQYYKLKLLCSLFLGLGVSAVWGQSTVLSYTGGMVTYTVPVGVSSISIEALGGQGASGDAGFVGGLGASMYGEFDVDPGSTLIIAVGGQGQGQSSGTNGGGGGGSFVVLDDPAGAYTFAGGPFAGTNVTPLIVAGGGGGTRTSVAQNGNPGVAGDQGTSGSGSATIGGGTPATAPEAGGIVSGSSWGSGGGGFVGDGANDGSNGCGGDSFLNGAAGGTGCGSSGDNAAGGFGSGGQGRGGWGGGGGGGWSGGQGGRVAGGAGSYNVGLAQVNTTGVNELDGLVTITVLCNGLVPSIPVTGVCIGDELVLDVESVTGGTISWDGGVTDEVAFAPPLGTTTYTASSTSPDDCAFTIDISASEVPDITANASALAACEGSNILVYGENGDTYDWSGSDGTTPIDSVEFVAPMGTVTYTVIGSILGCEGPAAEITLEGAPQPDAIATATPATICLGEEFVLTGSGDGTEFYNWGGGISDGDAVSPAAAGTYVYTLIATSDLGCGDTTSVSVVVNAIPFVSAGLDMTFCEGDDVTLTASGDGPYDYTWSGGVTDGVAFAAEVGETTYTLTGESAVGCTDTDEVIITGIERPYVASSVITDEFFGFDGAIDITVAGGSGSYLYTWSHGPTTEDVTGLTDMSYTVIIDDITTDPGLCSGTETFTLTSFVSVDEEGAALLSAYPNPTTDELTVVYNGEFSYEVTTLVGQVVFNGTATDQENLSMANLAAGTYIVKVTANGQTSFVQIVKK